LYRQGHLKSNPITKVDAPKPARQILPSLTKEQVEYLIEQADNLRGKAIISLFADSGMRLSELASVKASDIDWENYGTGAQHRKTVRFYRLFANSAKSVNASRDVYLYL
jgi:integrase